MSLNKGGHHPRQPRQVDARVLQETLDLGAQKLVRLLYNSPTQAVLRRKRARISYRLDHGKRSERYLGRPRIGNIEQWEHERGDSYLKRWTVVHYRW